MIDWLRKDQPQPQIELDGRILPIELRRHASARRLTLRLAPDGSAVRITLPRWCASKEAVAFAHARREWLAAQLAKLPQPHDPVATRRLTYRGEEIVIEWDAAAPRRAVLNEATLRLGGPFDSLQPRLARWLEGEAQQLFTEDARFYCNRANLPAAPVRITRAKRRWGSCSSEGMLRLNWRLVQAPDTIRRSVVAHEVAHLVHFDHSRAFHSLLGRLFEGDVDQANRWLSKHGRTLYSSFG